ncbi:MAG: hypothetical protein GWN67_16365 [Phycisphaerae bacterium]|nr:hypothetical protein [Phycisphaerae bacterium]NIP54163.1 hypothetical protein [Phycisphaerae bacterium]NIS53051.1 hypothetical protein [Phycisphaerae bacterium]NIU10540.1 hypothetical protein [Phycisphaerae bacterium]NIU57905.1 hypothetical protein [Phycisphaerae bacterium]
MERKEGKIKAGCVKILWSFMVVLLCAVPSVQASETVPGGEEWYIDYDVGGILNVSNSGIANVVTGFYAANGIYADYGSTVNIWGGTIVYPYWIDVINWPVAATVTVYGTDFADEDGPIPTTQTQWTPDGGSEILTVQFTNENGDPIGDPCNLLFHSTIPIYLDSTGTPPPDPPPPPICYVVIDIKPGSDPNPINPGSNGLVPVAILTTDEFDASTVDPSTVTLAGADVAVRGKSDKTMARLEDVDGDGDDDLMLQVDTESMAEFGEGGEVILTGYTYEALGKVEIQGTDYVIIVPPE